MQRCLEFSFRFLNPVSDNIKYIRYLIDIARNFNKDINEDQSKVSHFYLGNDFFVPIEEVTVKQLQSRLKLALGKTSEVDYDQKIGVDHVDTSDILTIRKQVRNVKLRNVYYRLINKDFFNGVKMKKYKMIESDNCERCQQSETIEHLMWGCKWSRIAWENFNVIMLEKGERESTVNSYKDIYNFNNKAAVNTIKLKIINEFIQINRPKNLNKEKIKMLIDNVRNTEKFIAVKNKQLINFKTKWKLFE